MIQLYDPVRRDQAQMELICTFLRWNGNDFSEVYRDMPGYTGIADPHVYEDGKLIARGFPALFRFFDTTGRLRC